MTMKFITITGDNALTVATDANIQPEILYGSLWAPARSLAQARSIVKDSPECVRLRGTPRSLVENILHQSIEPDQDVGDVIRAALLNGLGLHSLPIIQAAIA
jgi:hypothetical protein